MIGAKLSFKVHLGNKYQIEASTATFLVKSFSMLMVLVQSKYAKNKIVSKGKGKWREI